MAKKKSELNKEGNIILPLLALDNHVLTPCMPQPIKIDNEEQQKFLDNCIKSKSDFFVATSLESPHEGKQLLKNIGLVCQVDKVLQMPGAPSLAFVKPLYRAELEKQIFSPGGLMVKVTPLPSLTLPKRMSKQLSLIIERVDKLLNETLNFTGEQERETALNVVAENSENLIRRLYAISHIAPINWEDKYLVLECNTFPELAQTVALVLDTSLQKLHIQMEVHEKTHREISQQQKENFLRIHLKQIKEELGEFEENEDISDLLTKSLDKNWSDDTRKHFDKELQKLRRLNINNPEYSVQYAYLEAFLDLPWNKYSRKKISLDKVEEILNRDHYGLDKVKERILEYMAVVMLRKDLKAPILCLYGPPGVGKTSIGKSVAEATGREYKRIALGGMHDEAEIRGHRRTYIGAMPGRFLHALSKCKFGNPLILLDEIDKVGKDFKGDPSSALLEALDPEQNNSFHDNFIDHPYDLSQVLFIATANDLSTIPPPLRDRMEIIEMEKYSVEEKKEIAFRHLINQALTENGFKKDEVKFSKDAIDLIIRKFTREAGVRQLKMQIAKIIRKLAFLKVKGKKLPNEITPKLVNQLLEKKDSYHNSLGFRE